MIEASVPEEVILSISTFSNLAQTSSASSTSPAVGAPKLVPLDAAALTASTTAGWA